MPSIDPWIIEDEIKMYQNVKSVRQKLRVVN